MIEILQSIRSQRGFSSRETLQTFFQITVLKNLAWKEEKFIGGTALVFGFGNPRFSEDIDLTNVKNPASLESGLKKATRELTGWLGEDLEGDPALMPPKKGKTTWKISAKTRREGLIRLHIDSQKYPAHSHHPMIIAPKGIPPFIIAGVSLEEIMADKLVALALRNYVGGRDLFDLWFHWLKNPPEEMDKKIFLFLQKKKKDRGIHDGIFDKIIHRLPDKIPPRVLDEWNRYLPSSLKEESLYEEIYSSACSSLSKLGSSL